MTSWVECMKNKDKMVESYGFVGIANYATDEEDFVFYEKINDGNTRVSFQKNICDKCIIEKNNIKFIKNLIDKKYPSISVNWQRYYHTKELNGNVTAWIRTGPVYNPNEKYFLMDEFDSFGEDALLNKNGKSLFFKKQPYSSLRATLNENDETIDVYIQFKNLSKDQDIVKKFPIRFDISAKENTKNAMIDFPRLEGRVGIFDQEQQDKLKSILEREPGASNQPNLPFRF
jgi:hypothetical protein